MSLGWGTVGGVSFRVRIGCHLTKFDSDWNTYLLVRKQFVVVAVVVINYFSVSFG